MVASDTLHIRISADLTRNCWGLPLSFLKGVSLGRETGVLVLDNLQHSVPVFKCHVVLSPHSSQCRWKGSAEKTAAALQEREGRIQGEESQVERKHQVSSPFSLSSWLAATLTCRRTVAVSIRFSAPHALQRPSCSLGHTLSSDLSCVHLRVYFVSFESSNLGIIWAGVTWSAEWPVYLKILDLERPCPHETSTISLWEGSKLTSSDRDRIFFHLCSRDHASLMGAMEGDYTISRGRSLCRISTQAGLEPYFVRVLENNSPRPSPPLR